MDGAMGYVIIGLTAAVPVVITGGGVIFSYGRLSRKVDDQGGEIITIRKDFKTVKDDIKTCTQAISDQGTEIGELRGYRNGQRNSK